MPLNANPDSLLPYVLLTDRDAPEPKPTFLLRYLTSLELDEVGRLIDAASQCETAEEIDANWCKAVAIGLGRLRDVKFRGEPVTLATPLKQYLTIEEVRELVIAVKREPQLDAEKKRESASSALSVKASSATNAPAESVTTPPPPVPPT